MVCKISMLTIVSQRETQVLPQMINKYKYCHWIPSEDGGDKYKKNI